MLLPLLQQPLLHGDPGEEVQGGEGLVQQQQIAARQHGAGKGRPLAHSAGELLWQLILTARKTHVRQGLLRQLPPLRPGVPAPDLQGQGQVLPHGAPGKEQVPLGHIAAVVRLFRNGRAVHPDGPGPGPQQSADQAENGALAAPAGAHDAVEGSGVHGEAQAVNNVEIPAGILVGDVLKRQGLHGRVSQAMSQKPSS